MLLLDIRYEGFPPPQPKRSHKGRWIALVIGVIVLFACIGGIPPVASNGNNANTGTKVNSTTVSHPASTTVSTSVPTTQHFKVGEQVKVGNTWMVTVNSATSNAGSQFSTPAQGKTYLVVDVTLNNISSQEQDVSSLLQFTLKDSTEQKYTETITDFATPPDGKVAASDVLRGQLVYEVPTSMHQFTFLFEANPFQPGQTIWDVTI